VLDQERVKPVLGEQRVLHAPGGREHPDAADAPVERPGGQQAVVVLGLVRAMEAADAPMHDAGRHAAPVVGGDSDGP